MLARTTSFSVSDKTMSEDRFLLRREASTVGTWLGDEIDIRTPSKSISDDLTTCRFVLSLDSPIATTLSADALGIAQRSTI